MDIMRWLVALALGWALTSCSYDFGDAQKNAEPTSGTSDSEQPTGDTDTRTGTTTNTEPGTNSSSDTASSQDTAASDSGTSTGGDTVSVSEAEDSDTTLPSGERCGSAIPVTAGTYLGSTLGLANDYSVSGASCMDYTWAFGPDQVFVAQLLADERIDVTLTPIDTFDAVLYAVTNCADVTGTCVDGSDGIGADGVETISFIAAQATTLYIIADGLLTDNAGAFELVVTRTNTLPITLHYWERIWWDFAAYDTHRILVGPHNSTDPEDGSWTVLAGALAMLNADANGQWTPGHAVDLSSLSGTPVRLAFHYAGLDADGWNLDDLCLGRTPVSEPPATCFWQETWDSGVGPSLPSGWLVAPGADHVVDIIEESVWYRDSLKTHSEPYCAESPWSPRTRQSQYLVSPAILLP